MRVKVIVKSGKKWVKAAMFATMGKEVDPHSTKDLSEETFKKLLVGKHSPIEEYEVFIYATVPERVHTHVVRHKELGKYVATSRPDIKYHTEIGEGERFLVLRFNAKRLIEVMNLRLCNASWKETRELFNEIKQQMITIEPAFDKLLVPTCIWCGFCSEMNNKCTYFRTPEYAKERGLFLSNIQELHNK